MTDLPGSDAWIRAVAHTPGRVGLRAVEWESSKSGPLDERIGWMEKDGSEKPGAGEACQVIAEAAAVQLV